MTFISKHPWHLVAGWVIWAVWFTLIYAGMSVACTVSGQTALGSTLNIINLSLMLVSLCVISYLCVCAWQCKRKLQNADAEVRFTFQIAFGVYISSALGTLAVSITLFIISACSYIG
jgi:hypothetical protein